MYIVAVLCVCASVAFVITGLRDLLVELRRPKLTRREPSPAQARIRFVGNEYLQHGDLLKDCSGRIYQVTRVGQGDIFLHEIDPADR